MQPKRLSTNVARLECRRRWDEFYNISCLCARACMRAGVCACARTRVVWRSVCVSFAGDSSKTVKVITINLGTVTASDMRMHNVLIISTQPFVQSHTDVSLNVGSIKFLSNNHHVSCEDSPTKGLYNIFWVRWPWPSLKVTTALPSWHFFNFFVW